MVAVLAVGFLAASAVCDLPVTNTDVISVGAATAHGAATVRGQPTKNGTVRGTAKPNAAVSGGRR